MNLIALGPEIIIMTTGLLVLVVDMFIAENKRDAISYVSLSGLFLALIYMAVFWSKRGIVLGTLQIDDLAMLIRVSIIVACIMVNLAAIKNTRTIQEHQGEFFALLLFSVCGAMILTGARTLITIYLGLELSTIPMYILVIFRKDMAKAGEAAIKYFLLGVMSSIFWLYGLTMIFGITGQLELEGIAKSLSHGFPPIIIIASLFCIVGFGFKITLVPFHFWAPDTYEGAPLVVVSYLATVLKLGAFVAISRFFFVGLIATKANWPLWFGTLAVITMTLGNVMALPQNNIKRMMAYSGISHIGYPLVAMAVGTHASISAMFFYLITYVFSTIGVFFVMYARSTEVDTDDIDGYTGLSETNPVLAFVMTISFLSLIGLPPFAGFFGKFYILQDAVANGRSWLAVALLINSVISFGYYSKVIRAMYLSETKIKKITGIAVPTNIALGMATIAIIFLGIAQRPIWQLSLKIFNYLKL
ncbi:MAG: NADH-quinone oxidoreductase subunit N [Actinobacteria bacterium]|nr:MAG: NADH-quinone oxidoreductase subunit N [Actinomycetota bacterium]